MTERTLETCLVQLTYVCKGRQGKAAGPDGYFTMLNGDPIFICNDCITLIKQMRQKRSGES